MGTSQLRDGDVDLMLQVIEDGRHDDPGEAMPWALLDGLQRLVPCDLGVSYHHYDYRRCHTLTQQDLDAGGIRVGPEHCEPDPPDDPFWLLWWTNLCSWPQRTGNLARVTLERDFYPSELAWRNDPLREVLPDVWDTMAVHLPAAPGHARRIIFFRVSGPLFTERDRQVASLLRPHLQEIWLEAERRRNGVPQLTPRERQVLGIAAAGLSYAEIAGLLYVSTSTVRKHMEHVRERLGVHSVAAAAALALPHAPSDQHVRVPGEGRRRRPAGRARP